MKSGVYKTFFGNVCIVEEVGENKFTAYDIDMGEKIPLEFVEWNEKISDDIEDYL